MRILHTSDWHIGRSLNGYSLLEDQQAFLQWLLGFMQLEKVDALLVAGDIYQTTSPSAAAVSLLDWFVTETILKLHIPVLLLSGNHDSPERLRFSSRLLEREGLTISADCQAGVKRVELRGDCGRVGIDLLPYLDPAAVREMFPEEPVKSFDQALSLVAEKLLPTLDCDVNILASHGFFLPFGEDAPKLCDSELRVGPSESVNLSRFEGYDYVALGHLHGPQKVGKNGYYSGSPLKYSVSEASQKKQVNLIEIGADRTVHMKPILTPPLRDLRVVRGTLEELCRHPSDDYLSVELTDETYLLSPMEQLKAAFPHILEMSYVCIQNHLPTSALPVRTQSPDELFSTFFREVTGKEMTRSQKSLLDELVKQLDQQESA